MTIKVSEYDVATDETTIRELKGEELAQYETDVLKRTQAKAEAEAEASQRADAKAALLERLGITEDEAKLLLA